MKVTVTTNHYLINFKYPVIARYSCYECPGAYYIDWKEARWFKTGSTTKSHTASPLEEMIITANKAREQWEKKWLERYDEEMDFWADKYNHA